MTQTELDQQSQGMGKTVKRVTNLDVIRRGANGQAEYELELTLDGAHEFVMRVPTDEVSTILRNFQHSESILFNTQSQELIFERFK
jgi:hypothetical protein